MKKLITICLLIMASFKVNAQEKPELSRRETVDYLNKKIKEIEGHWRTPTSGSGRLYYENAVLYYEESSSLLVLKTQRKNKLLMEGQCDYYEYSNETRFNPVQIKNIIFGDQYSNENIGVLKLQLSVATAKEIRNNYSYAKINNNNGVCYNFGLSRTEEISSNEILIPFISSDPSNFNKLKKALEHLKKLCKAEDDPFGE